jgi:RNA polymerase sigma-70 factor, ECF subfamily
MIRQVQPQTGRDGEAQLYKRVCRGDAAAFERLCLTIEAPLFNYLLRMVCDRPEAEDIAQESLLRLFRACRNGQAAPDKGSLRALLFSIAHNLAVDWLRRQGRDLPNDSDPPAPAQASAQAERLLLREQIDHALASLPPAHRSALTLRAFGELSYAEIAAILDTKEGAVKTWIYRARQRMAELLDRDGQYVGDQNHGV